MKSNAPLWIVSLNTGGTPEPPGPSFNAATGGIESIVDNYKDTGQRWKVHVFEKDTSPAVLDVTANEMPFHVLVVAGGMGAGYFAGKVTNGGEVIEQNVNLFVGEADVTVGAGGYNANPGVDGVGQPSVFAGLTAVTNQTSASVPSSITGVEVQYGGNGNTSGIRGRGSVGQGGTATGGQPGIVVIAYPIGVEEVQARGGVEGEITRLHHQLPEIPEELLQEG